MPAARRVPFKKKIEAGVVLPLDLADLKVALAEMNRVVSPFKPWVAIALVIGFAIATLFLTRPAATVSVPGASVSGLKALHASAQAAVSYEAAIASEKPMLLEFYADWCTTCQAIAPVLQQLHQRYGEHVNFVMLNIDDPQWAAQVEQFNVSGVPQLTLMDAQQTVVHTWIGSLPRSVLAQALQQVLPPNAYSPPG